VLNEEAKAQVAKEMIAWQIQQAMKKKGRMGQARTVVKLLPERSSLFE
jgi:hypothetical protein